MGRRGFTLVELLVVIGICGILFSLSFPSLHKLRLTVLLEGECQATALAVRKAAVEALVKAETVACPPFKFAASGFPLPGYSGTLVLSPYRKIILSSVGRVRIE